MKQIILIISILVVTLIFGCGKDSTTTAPYMSSIFLNPEAMSYSIISTAPLVSVQDYVNITVLDKNGLPAPNQELFFRPGSYMTLRDSNHDLIDTSVGDVHGVTGDSGNYVLWVEFLAGQGLKYTTSLRVTSATNDAWMDVEVDNTGE